MPLMFDMLERELGPRVAALDLPRRARHAHADERCAAQRAGRAAGGRRPRRRRGASSITAGTTRRRSSTLGTIPAREIAELTGGRLRQDVPVALNRLATEYDHVLICGPVFPHEVVGFSGGTKYLFPGIAAPEIIHFTHWLGALITSYEVIGTIETPVRAVIDRAAALLDTPALAAGAGRDARRRGRHVLRRRARGVAAGRRRCHRAATSSGSTSPTTACSRSCRRCTTTCGRRPRACTRREPVVADGGEVDHLRAARRARSATCTAG